jgi:hypothetical protein
MATQGHWASAGGGGREWVNTQYGGASRVFTFANDFTVTTVRLWARESTAANTNDCRVGVHRASDGVLIVQSNILTAGVGSTSFAAVDLSFPGHSAIPAGDYVFSVMGTDDGGTDRIVIMGENASAGLPVSHYTDPQPYPNFPNPLGWDTALTRIWYIGVDYSEDTGTPGDASGAGVTATISAPAGSAAAFNAYIRDRLIDKNGSVVANETGITAIIRNTIPTSATAPPKVVTGVSSNATGHLAIDVSDIVSAVGDSVNLELWKAGSPYRAGARRVVTVT